MSNKFNANALTEYSRSYARRVATDFYQKHATINGQQILSLTPISQINMFVLSSLSDKWQADAAKFRSPYFDFTDADVQEALQNFMNVVSQHICVRREHLEPLLADAARRTIIMIFDPRAYFDEILRSQPEFTLTAAALKHITRYTKINQFIPAHITQRIKDKPFVYANQAIGYLDEALTQRGHELEHYDKFVALFSEKLPMDVSALLRSHVPDVIPNAPSRSFFDTATESTVPPAPLVAAEVSPSTETVQENATATVAPAIPPQPVPASVEEIKESLKEISAHPAPVDDSDVSGPMFLQGGAGPEPVAPISQPSQLQTGAITQPATSEPAQPTVPAATTPTLNDTIREAAPAEPANSIAETFHRAPIESIARSISLNQKFRFINQLFNGNASEYSQAIQEIDTLNNYGQALDLISDQYASQYIWDMKSDEVSELVEILKRRFS
ncbi:hypothetical protein [Spirosoma endophyticum]|uniref:Uncharacterized protein n=1 Tax=Spirosoma endophyticum TaxID=662367 RepID=A0A1I1P452_9BACT|nr:hypothetical protein [Spirosoma endophyticum]SFD04734.1 hypothetical protein SAMN05216167_103110 [Spirosoma endophyticum]